MKFNWQAIPRIGRLAMIFSLQCLIFVVLMDFEKSYIDPTPICAGAIFIFCLLGFISYWLHEKDFEEATGEYRHGIKAYEDDDGLLVMDRVPPKRKRFDEGRDYESITFAEIEKRRTARPPTFTTTYKK